MSKKHNGTSHLVREFRVDLFDLHLEQREAGQGERYAFELGLPIFRPDVFKESLRFQEAITAI